jgi:hypothetical protein
MTVTRVARALLAGAAVAAAGCTETTPLGVDSAPGRPSAELLGGLGGNLVSCSPAGLLPKRIALVRNSSLDILELVASADDLQTRRVTRSLTHFSSYAIAW